MKILITFLTLVSVANANTVLVLQRSTEKGGEQKALLMEGEKLRVIKNTNVYDKKVDNRVGEFQSEMTSDLHQKEERLSLISKSLKLSEKMLKDKKSSFEALDKNANPHGNKIYLDQVLVNESSTYYQELLKLVTELDTTAFTQVDGARLSKDKKKLEIVKAGKVVSEEKFIIPFFCNQARLPASCKLRDFGTVELK